MTRITRLAVGIPTFQEADSIENVVRQVDEGLLRLCAPSDCVIVNVDSDSLDRTSEVFLNTPTRCRKESFVISAQPRGKGRNVLRFFEYCAEQSISALAIVDGDLRSITPDWIEALLTPVLRGEADYVAPLYQRHRFDGSLTNHFAYPLLNAYFGRAPRQPVGGEFAFSASFLDYLLRQPLADAMLGYGIDIFLTTNALGGGFKLAQARLARKLHKLSLPKWHLIQPQAIAAALGTLRQYQFQPANHGPENLPDLPDSIDDLSHYPLYDEVQALLTQARARARELKPVYLSWLAWLGAEPEALFAAFADNGTALSAETWAELVTGGSARAIWDEPQTPAQTFADYLAPVLLIRTITSWNATWQRPIKEFNAEISYQAQLFRIGLLQRWRDKTSES
jgi:hypothetical protein